MNINVDRFVEKEAISDFLELAEIGGYDVIRLISKVPRSALKVSGFEIPKQQVTRGPRGNHGAKPVIVRGTVKFHLDKSKYCMGFVIDTPHNRRQIAYNIANGDFEAMSEKDKQDIKELAIKEGIRVTPLKRSNRFVNRSKNEDRISKRLDKKEAEAFELKLKLEQMESEAKALKEKLAASHEAIAKKQSDVATATSVAIDDEGEPVAIEVPAEVKPDTERSVEKEKQKRGRPVAKGRTKAK